MTIAIAGATGRLGHEVVDALLQRGVDPKEIVAGGRNTTLLDGLAQRGVRTAVLDYDRPATLQMSLHGADQLLLISGGDMGRRVPQHRAVLEAAAASGITHVAYTGVLGADKLPFNWAFEHLGTEAAMRELGFTNTFLHPGWYHENYTSYVDQAASTGNIVTASADGAIASAAIRDYAEAAAAVLTEPTLQGRTWELSGDEAWRIDDLAHEIGLILGKPVTVQHVTPGQFVAAMRAQGVAEWLSNFLGWLEEMTARGFLASTNGELSELIGRPTTPIRNAVHVMARAMYRPTGMAYERQKQTDEAAQS